MEQSPSWEADSRSASQIPPFFNLKIRYCVYRNLPLVLIQSQMNSDHIFTPYLFKISFYSIRPSALMTPKWCLSFGVSDKNFAWSSSLPARAACHILPILVYSITLITLGGRDERGM
jgi:hypothetical protein